MNTPSGKLSRVQRYVCPFSESGGLSFFGPGLARCGSCGPPLLGAMLGTLRGIAGLPEARGAHPCEYGHPQMRRLPDDVFHCPARGSEVLPVQVRVPDARGKDTPWSAT